jgi:hypothetical protein
MTIIGSRFSNNTSGVAGGALLVNGQNLQLQDTLFERNQVRLLPPADSMQQVRQVEGSNSIVKVRHMLAEPAAAGHSF